MLCYCELTRQPPLAAAPLQPPLPGGPILAFSLPGYCRLFEGLNCEAYFQDLAGAAYLSGYATNFEENFYFLTLGFAFTTNAQPFTLGFRVGGAEPPQIRRSRVNIINIHLTNSTPPIGCCARRRSSGAEPSQTRRGRNG